MRYLQAHLPQEYVLGTFNFLIVLFPLRTAPQRSPYHTSSRPFLHQFTRFEKHQTKLLLGMMINPSGQYGDESAVFPPSPFACPALTLQHSTSKIQCEIFASRMATSKGCNWCSFYVVRAYRSGGRIFVWEMSEDHTLTHARNNGSGKKRRKSRTNC